MSPGMQSGAHIAHEIPDDWVPVQPVPFKKVAVRPRIMPKGYNVPAGNLLQIYLEACERLQVSANSGVANQLFRRVRMVQPLPFHLTIDHPCREQQMQLVLQHLSVGPFEHHGLKLIEQFTLMNPRVSAEDFLGLIDVHDDQVTPTALSTALQKTMASLSDAEFTQSVLEVLSHPFGLASRNTRELLQAVVDHFDVGKLGYLTASEVRIIITRLCQTVDLQQLAQRMPVLQRGNNAQVTLAECMDVIEVAFAEAGADFAAAGSVAQQAKLEVHCNDLLEFKQTVGFEFDFSRDMIGEMGLLPLVEALRHDEAFTSLNLANCGLYDASCKLLHELLATHPCITHLDLSNNRISDRGGLELLQLVRTNCRIVVLRLEGVHLHRRYSRIHHDAMGPSSCEDAVAISNQLLENHELTRHSPAEIVRLLHAHQTEVKTIFYALADTRGRAGLSELELSLSDLTYEWGFSDEALAKVIHSERLLGTGFAERTVGSTGKLQVTFDELYAFLRSDDGIARVTHSVRYNRLQVKQLFWKLATDPDSTSGAASETGSPQNPLASQHSSPLMVRLPDLLAAITEAACEIGSGWDVSVEDLQSVLLAHLFVHHSQFALIDEEMPLDTDGALRLSWRGFFNTICYLHQR